MQTPARIALAIFIVAVGIAGAWLFRKAPQTADSGDSAENSASSLSLHEPPSAAEADTWRPANAPRPPAKKPLAGIGTGDLNAPPSPPLPVPQALPRGPVIHLNREQRSPPASVSEDDSTLWGAEDEPQLHVLADGDTLAALAEHYLGDRSRMNEILDANRGVIGNPEILPVGTTLRIPPRQSGSRPAAVRRLPPTGR
jgi:nucleoid-associated protein YgaU